MQTFFSGGDLGVLKQVARHNHEQHCKDKQHAPLSLDRRAGLPLAAEAVVADVERNIGAQDRQDHLLQPRSCKKMSDVPLSYRSLTMHYGSGR